MLVRSGKLAWHIFAQGLGQIDIMKSELVPADLRSTGLIVDEVVLWIAQNHRPPESILCDKKAISIMQFVNFLFIGKVHFTGDFQLIERLSGTKFSIFCFMIY